MNFDIAVISTINGLLAIHEVHNIPDVLEARLTLGVSAFNILKAFHGDLFVGYANKTTISFLDQNVEQNPTQEVGYGKNISELKLNEVALVECEDETALDVYTADMVITGWVTNTAELKPKCIGQFKFHPIASVVLPELRTKIAELESHWNTIAQDKREMEDTLTNKNFQVEDLVRQVLTLTVNGRSIEVANKNLNTQVDLLTSSLVEAENNIQLRGEDCKRLVIENARLRDADDKNYMAIMRLNNEIMNLRNAQTVSNYQSFVKKSLTTFDESTGNINASATSINTTGPKNCSPPGWTSILDGAGENCIPQGHISFLNGSSENDFVNKAFAPHSTCIRNSTINMDIKPVQRVTQDTVDESSYDECIKKIKNFDISMLKSKNSERTLDLNKITESSKKSRTRSEINRRK